MARETFSPFHPFHLLRAIGSLAEAQLFVRILVTKISVFISQFALGIDAIPKRNADF